MLKDHGLGMCEEVFFSMTLSNIKMYGITATVPSDIGMAANKNRKKTTSVPSEINCVTFAIPDAPYFYELLTIFYFSPSIPKRCLFSTRLFLGLLTWESL